MAAERSAGPNPILVLAPARSFTSVVAAMIGQHPQLHAFPELNLFRAEVVGELLERESTDPVPHQLSGLLRALAQLHDGSQTDAAVDAARKWLDARTDWSCVAVLEHLLEGVAPQRAIDKSPSTLLEEDALARALDACPRAPLIHLVRHPVTTAASMHEHWGRNARADAPSPADCVLMWCLLHRRALRLLDALAEEAPERSIRVRAEDVLNAPLTTLAPVARWLGVAEDETALKEMTHPERSAYVGIGPASAPFGAAGEFLADPAPHAVEVPAEVVFPAEWKVPPKLARTAIELADRFGYPGPRGPVP